MTQVLVVKPKTLNAADKSALRKAGVVVVEASNPSAVRMLQTEGAPLEGNDLFYAAIKAIAADKFSCNTAEHFAKTLARMAETTMPAKGESK